MGLFEGWKAKRKEGILRAQEELEEARNKAYKSLDDLQEARHRAQVAQAQYDNIEETLARDSEELMGELQADIAKIAEERNQKQLEIEQKRMEHEAEMRKKRAKLARLLEND